MTRNFDGFTVNLYQEDDGQWLAHFVELPEVSAFADTAEQALAELARAWKAVKAAYRAEKLPLPVAPARKRYSGSFNVRIDRNLHRALAVEASRLGVSLNAVVAKKLAQTTASV